MANPEILWRLGKPKRLSPAGAGISLSLRVLLPLNACQHNSSCLASSVAKHFRLKRAASAEEWAIEQQTAAERKEGEEGVKTQQLRNGDAQLRCCLQPAWLRVGAR